MSELELDINASELEQDILCQRMRLKFLSLLYDQACLSLPSKSIC